LIFPVGLCLQRFGAALRRDWRVFTGIVEISALFRFEIPPRPRRLIQSKSPGAKRKKKPPGFEARRWKGKIGRKRPKGRERDRETPQRNELISQRSILQGEWSVTFL
jgi:hypothetical protein